MYTPIIFYGLLIICCIPVVSAPVALIAGLLFGLLIGNPWPGQTSVWSKRLLQLSVVGLGFGVNLPLVLKTGQSAFWYTLIGISMTMLAGLLLGRLFKTASKTSMLISFGTAICGGSAIAALAPVLKAENEETGVALATVFTLNSLGLLLFPPLGHLLQMSQGQFGLWSALAIHDTSSVVGATAAYGTTALAVGTTVKLTRALWIMPVTLAVAWFVRSEGKVSVPYFIVGFILAAGVRTAFPQAMNFWMLLNGLARQALVVTLFLIGAGFTRKLLVRTGLRPLLQGVVLWLVVSVTSATAILAGWIG